MSEPRQTLFRSPSGDAEVILGDGPSVLAEILAAEPVALVLTDPPYGVLTGTDIQKPTNRRTGHEGIIRRAADWDHLTPRETRLLYRRLLDACAAAPHPLHLHVFCPDWLLSWLRYRCEHVGLDWHLAFTWCKTNPPPRIRRSGHRAAVELAGVMSKDAPPFYDSNSPNWFACPFESSTRKRHFCQKPQALLQHLIQCYTRPGDLVVDPFGGSGSTVDAARCLGRRGIMIEANPATAATAATYFAEGAASGRRAAAEAGHLPPPSQDRRQMSLPG